MKNFIFKNLGILLKSTFRKWNSHDPFREGAIIGYSSIFALPGLLVVVTTIVGYFFGADTVNGRLHMEIARAMGNATADQIQQMVKMASSSRDSLWASGLGVIFIIIGAIGVFVELQKSFNIIWEVKAQTSRSGIWKFLRSRLFSFGLIITMAFLLLVSLVISSLLAAFGSWIQSYWSESLLIIFKILNIVFNLGIITLLFALMFKFLPDAKIRWHSVWMGAMTTSLLFMAGKSAMGLYFGKANPGVGYGAAGSVILILLWTSYSSMIVFFGAEFTKVFSDYYYGEIPPSDFAVRRKGRRR